MEVDHHFEELTKSLYAAIIELDTPQEAENFIKDLCTPQEIKSLCERWTVCQLLNEGKLSYRKISDITGASTTTICRVSRFLNHEPYKGYKNLLNKIERKKENVVENNNDNMGDNTM